MVSAASLWGVFGALWGASGPSFGDSGCHLERFWSVWGGLWDVFWGLGGNVKSSVFCSVFNGFQGFEGVRISMFLLFFGGSVQDALQDRFF